MAINTGSPLGNPAGAAPAPLPGEPSAATAKLTVTERAALGKAARKAVPRASHAQFEPSADRHDPVTLLQQQAASRVAELVPIRYGRMLVSRSPSSGARRW